MKPCQVRSTGKSYLRSYDGDYELSPLEEQAFLANREIPRFDQSSITGSSRQDLDEDLIASYIDTCRATSESLARFNDEEILFRTGVVSSIKGTPTIAGILALGSYPQQFFPNLVIQASVSPGPNDPPGTRAVDSRRFDGPIPIMLEQALRWVQRNTRTRVRFDYQGHGKDDPEYPMEAVREILSNALIHRDLGQHSLGEAVTLKLDHRQLILSNPGGLWGLTVDRLGKTGVTSARNGYLVRICQNVRYSRNQRVIEALATGIPTVLRSLKEAGMIPPRFHDQGVRFTVRMPNHTLLSPEDFNWLSSIGKTQTLSDIQQHALVAMKNGVRWTNKSLREAFPMDSTEARGVLASLVDSGIAEAIGKKGGRVYRLSKEISGKNSEQQKLPLSEGTPHEGPPTSTSSTTTKENPESSEDKPRRGARRRNAEIISTFLHNGPASISEISGTLNLTERQAQYALSLLREEESVELLGKRGDRSSKWILKE